jgi:hypothetical protein
MPLLIESHHPHDLEAVMRVMTVDHKAAYLNADMQGPPVEMMLNSEVTDILCQIDPRD